MWCVLYTSFANFCELLAIEVILMCFYLSIFAEFEPHGIISALAWRIMYEVIAKTVKLESLVSRIRKQCYLNLHRQQCLCTVKLISELWYIMHYAATESLSYFFIISWRKKTTYLSWHLIVAWKWQSAWCPVEALYWEAIGVW
jgi:hypothetical protein